MFLKKQLQRAGEWNRKNKRDILLVLLAFLIILLSFGLGYITARDFAVRPIVIEECSG